jgi:hypothetical protein
MEATMRKLFLTTAIVLSTTTARAGFDSTVGNADRSSQAMESSSQQRPDANVLAAKREAMMQQKKREAMMQQKAAMKKQMMMQKQMAMQREVQRHPIRTRLQLALLKFKRTMHAVFR